MTEYELEFVKTIKEFADPKEAVVAVLACLAEYWSGKQQTNV